MEIKKGNRVKVVNSGRTYSDFGEQAKAMKSKKWVAYNTCSEGDIGTIVSTKTHVDTGRDEVIALVDFDGKEVLIGVNGIEKIGKASIPTHIITWDTNSCGDPYYITYSIPETKKKILGLQNERPSDVIPSSIRAFEIKKELKVTTSIRLSGV